MGRAVGGTLGIRARIAAAQGLDPADVHGLAGFVAAEGCFNIVRNNDGRNWKCSFQIAQRADDTDMLEDLCRTSGIGRIFAVKPRHTSRPQALWTIASKTECRELVDLLRSAGLRGRKRREFEIWAAAVDLWSTSLYACRDAATDQCMADIAAALRRAKRYVPPPAAPTPAIALSDELLWFWGGFFSGEGHFQLSPKGARAQVHVRADDRPLLETYAAALGVGRVYGPYPRARWNPTVRWTVFAQPELRRLIDLMDGAVLRGRKRREFDVWRLGAEEFIAARREGRRRDHALIQEASEALRGVRRFRLMYPVAVGPEAKRAETRALYVDLLRTWADTVDGVLSCVGYERDREKHPSWPQRETIAGAFGGWREALAAAGLGDRLAAWNRADAFERGRI